MNPHWRREGKKTCQDNYLFNTMYYYLYVIAYQGQKELVLSRLIIDLKVLK